MERRTHRLQGSGKLRANWFIFVAGGWPDRRSELQKKIGPYCFQGDPDLNLVDLGLRSVPRGLLLPGGQTIHGFRQPRRIRRSRRKLRFGPKSLHTYVRCCCVGRASFVAFHQALAGHALTLRLLPLPSPRAHHDPHGAGHDARGALVGDARAAAGAAGSAWR